MGLGVVTPTSGGGTRRTVKQDLLEQEHAEARMAMLEARIRQGKRRTATGRPMSLGAAAAFPPPMWSAPQSPLPPSPATSPSQRGRPSLIVVPPSILRSTPPPNRHDSMSASIQSISGLDSDLSPVAPRRSAGEMDDMGPPMPRRSSKVRFSQGYLPSAHSRPHASTQSKDSASSSTSSPLLDFKRDLEAARQQLRKASISSSQSLETPGSRLSELGPPRSTAADFSPKPLPYPKMSRTLARLSGSHEPMHAGTDGTDTSSPAPKTPEPNRKSSFTAQTPTSPTIPSPLSSSFSSGLSSSAYVTTRPSGPQFGSIASTSFAPSDRSRSFASSSGSSISLTLSSAASVAEGSCSSQSTAGSSIPASPVTSRVPLVNRSDWVDNEAGLSPRSVPARVQPPSTDTTELCSGLSSTRSSFALPAPTSGIPSVTLTRPWGGKAGDQDSIQSPGVTAVNKALEVRIHAAVRTTETSEFREPFATLSESDESFVARSLKAFPAVPERRPSRPAAAITKLVKRKSVNYGTSPTALIRRESSVYADPRAGAGAKMQVFMPPAILEPTLIEEPEASSASISLPRVEKIELLIDAPPAVERSDPQCLDTGIRPPPIPPRSPQRLLRKPPAASAVGSSSTGWSGSESEAENMDEHDQAVQQRRERAKLGRKRTNTGIKAPSSPPATPDHSKSGGSDAVHGSPPPTGLWLSKTSHASEMSLSSGSTEILTPPPTQPSFEHLSRSNLYSPLAARQDKSKGKLASHSAFAMPSAGVTGTPKSRALPLPSRDASDWGPPEVLLDEDWGDWRSRSVHPKLCHPGPALFLDDIHDNDVDDRAADGYVREGAFTWDNLPEAPMLWSEAPDPTWQDMMANQVNDGFDEDQIGLAI